MVVGSALAVTLLPAAPIDPRVEAALANGGQAAFWVMIRSKADMQPSSLPQSRGARSQAVIDRLQQAANQTQGNIRSWLSSQKVSYQSYWINNSLRVVGNENLMRALAARSDVVRIVSDAPLTLVDGTEPTIDEPVTVQATQWNLAMIGAPQVWQDYGVRGQGVVVATMDTGVQYDHPALIRQYRGALPDGTFDHNYNWYDPTGECPTGAPCDNHNHGTHVMGIILGETADGSVQIGVAPEAKWMAVKVCTGSGTCSREDVIAGAQWLLAPTDASGANPRPDLRPDIINNSWGAGDYTGDPAFFQPLVQAWVAAGIFPVAAQGNNVSGCGKAFYPGSYPETVAVGALTSTGEIASLSNRGPSPLDGTIKPDLVAPGISIYSSLKNSSYGMMSGTSMAAPHVTGAVALLWSIKPDYRGQVALTRTILGNSAPDVENLTCGGTSVDNNVYGMGRLNILAAIQMSDLKYHLILPWIMK